MSVCLCIYFRHTLCDADQLEHHSVSILVCGLPNPGACVNLRPKLTWNRPIFNNFRLWEGVGKSINLSGNKICFFI